MALHCPLCLKELESRDVLLRFCPLHPEKSESILIRDYQPEKLLCPDRQCRQTMPDRIAHSVLMLHRGCDCRSPFWMTDRVDADAIASSGVDHWQLPLLLEASRHFPHEAAMWFPQMLFRSYNETDKGELFGVQVLLAGARSSGKSVLSTMALLPGNYGVGDVENFVYMLPHGAINPQHEFLQTVQTVADLKQSRPVTFKPTPMLYANLKSAYLQASSGNGIATRQGDLKDLFEVIWREFFGSVRSSAPPTHIVLTMRDTAGEQWQRDVDLTLPRLRAASDVVAVFLDATSLSALHTPALAHHTQISRDSVKVAATELNRLEHFHGKVCLIVTKLDLIDSAEAQSVMRAIQAREPHTDAARELLCQWLQPRHPDEARLRNALIRNQRVEVFFVWTEGLEAGSPVCYGLESFLLWSLGKMQKAVPAGAGR